MPQSKNALEIFPSLNRTKVELKDPVVFRSEDEQFIIRNLISVKDQVMCELEMDDDKMMRPYLKLPPCVQHDLDERLQKMIA